MQLDRASVLQKTCLALPSPMWGEGVRRTGRGLEKQNDPTSLHNHTERRKLSSMKHIHLTIFITLSLAACQPPEAVTFITPTSEPTHTPVPTETPLPTATSLPLPTETPVPPTPTPAPIESNSDWEPVIREFGGVEMVLVPPGCFTMGADDNFADDDEFPLSEQCFDAPFWIDRTEVSNLQYGTAGSQVGPNLPRDSVTLPEAVAHCESRDARLPTEAEWEYAARGPDGLRYPWGNEFGASKVVYVGTSPDRSQPVGSIPEGASWVGALDMAGNLWEWTSTLYIYKYPYDATDGRENLEDTNNFRAIRGGAYSTAAGFTRTTARKEKHPTLEFLGYVGFRCARDEE